MPVFSAPGWLLKNKAKPAMVTSTGLSEQEFKKDHTGITATVTGTFTRSKLKLDFTISNVSAADPGMLRGYNVYFRVNVDEKEHDDNGGWTSYLNTSRTIDVASRSYTITINRNQFSGLILDYIQQCTKMYISFRNSGYYLCDSHDDPDFRVSLTK